MVSSSAYSTNHGYQRRSMITLSARSNVVIRRHIIGLGTWMSCCSLVAFPSTASTGLSGYSYGVIPNAPKKSELEKVIEYDDPSRWVDSTESTSERFHTLKEAFTDRERQRRVAGTMARQQELSIPEQVAEIGRLTSAARDAEARITDYSQAVAYYDEIIDRFPELAITQYARIARGLALFQLGDKREAILQLDELAVTLRGKPEVHAALAVMEYSLAREKGGLLAAAYISSSERQWEEATELNENVSDIAYVKTRFRWPPAMIAGLEDFLSLR